MMIIGNKMYNKYYILLSTFIEQFVVGSQQAYSLHLQTSMVNAKWTVAKFVRAAKLKHGNAYDYRNLTKWTTISARITIICNIHGPFEQVADSHLRSGCRKCGRARGAQQETSNAAISWKARCIEKFGEQIDYSHAEYVNAITPVKLVCIDHGEFFQTPTSHQNSEYGCPSCVKSGIQNTKKMGFDEFKRRALEVHSGKYQYEEVAYENQNTLMTIICANHGLFQQSGGSHLQGHGCQKCAAASRTGTGVSRNPCSAHPWLVERWSPNNILQPNEVGARSYTSILLMCKTCNHEINTNPIRWTQDKQPCAFCAGQKICEQDDCIPCYDKSFASHPLSDYWNMHLNDDVSPRSVFKSKSVQYWFDCPCGHTTKVYIGDLKDRTTLACPYCSSPPRELCENMDCVPCHEKSWASHPQASNWDDAGNSLSARQTFKKCAGHVALKCQYCENPFTARGCTIKAETSCGCLKSFLESEMDKELQRRGIQFETQWLPGINRLSFDFQIQHPLREHFALLEMDGRQHFNPSPWSGDQRNPDEVFRDQVDRDRQKDAIAKDRGFSLLRIAHGDSKRISECLDRFLAATSVTDAFAVSNTDLYSSVGATGYIAV